jgi:hypothetical protein
MLSYIRRNVWGVIGICLTATLVGAILWAMPKGSAQSAPQAEGPVASPSGQSTEPTVDTSAGAMPAAQAAESAPSAESLPIPAPPAQAGPEAGANPFEDAVLLLEASRYMESPASKNAALAQVATEAYQASYKMPDDLVGVELTVTAVPSKSSVMISDEYINSNVTYRTVSAYAYIEKHDRSGKLVGVIDATQLDVTTWVLGPDNHWKIERDGM